MSKSIFIASAEKLAGKSLVTLGVTKLSKQKFRKTAIFRPIIADLEKHKKNIKLISDKFEENWCEDESYGVTKAEAERLISSDNIQKLLEIVVNKYMAIYKKYDFIVCEGTGYHGVNTAFELELNSIIAKNLGTPVLFVASAANKTNEEANTAAKMGYLFFKSKSIPMIGAVLNMANETNTIQIEAPFVGLITDNSNVDTLKEINIEHFENSINQKNLFSTIENTPQGGMTYKMFEYTLLQKATVKKRHIVLPEGTDSRVLKAAHVLLERDIVDLTILGNIEEIVDKAKDLELDISKASLINPRVSSNLELYAKEFYEMRKAKGVTLEQAKSTMESVSYYATMMVKLKHADGMVSGAVHSTGDTIRPAFQILKTAPGVPVVSSVFFMCLNGRVSLYGDCAVNPNPTSEQLAAIAISSAETAKSFDIPTKVAFHSYSTGDSGAGPDVDLVREAVKIARELKPEIEFEGPIQYDAAVSASVAKKKMPNSKVAGKARVHIFPDLNTGNISYKTVQRESNCEAIGPMLQGLNGAINDLSRGCSVLDVINTTLITAIQAKQFDN